MEATITEQSWKGHTFTLLVFAGIVVLSSIFFMLGMLVGKAQGQKLASAAPAAAAAKADAKPATKEEGQVLHWLQGGPRHVDEIARESGIPVAQLSGTLQLLELEGRVRQAGPMTYALA